MTLRKITAVWEAIKPVWMSRQALAIEHLILRDLKATVPHLKNVLMAISGGMDSMVMAEILLRWSKRLDLQLAVAHVHHGESGESEQDRYRGQTQHFVREWAAQHSLPFFTNEAKAEERLKTEQEFRLFRELQIGPWAADFDTVAFAHHREDLLETRLIRLIRGSGGQGLRSMSPLRAKKFRPLLSLTREQIAAYATARNLRWIEDPSNENRGPLRNWIRREWLPQLENRRPGAKKALSRSLQTLTSSIKDRSLDSELAHFVGLRRESLERVSSQQQRELVAGYLKSLGLKNYGETHVLEIMKRLGAPRAEFELLGLNWKITPDLLWASRV